MMEDNKGIAEIPLTGKVGTNFDEVIQQLYRDASVMSDKELIENVNLLIEAYMQETGERMDSRYLEKLGTLLLHEALMDNHPDKMTRTEYPIMSEHQYKRRLAGERFQLEFRSAGVLIGHRALHYVGSNGQNYNGMQAIYQYPN